MWGVNTDWYKKWEIVNWLWEKVEMQIERPIWWSNDRIKDGEGSPKEAVV